MAAPAVKDVTKDLDVNNPRDREFIPEQTRLNMAARGLMDTYYFTTIILKYNKLRPNTHGPICAFADTCKAHRQIVQQPRTTFKTVIYNVSRNIQRAMRDPSLRWLIVGNTGTNASTHLQKIRNHLDRNGVLRWLYPNRFWENARAQAEEWSKVRLFLPTDAIHGEPTFDTIGAEGAVVSRHYDGMTIDDIIADDENLSAVEMAKRIEWASGLESLLVPPIEDGQMEVPCTYWAVDDVYAFLEKFWGGHHKPVVTGPFSYQRGPLAVFRRGAIEDGKSMFPEAFSVEWLERLQNENPERYAAQYANNPFASGVAEFRPEWLRYYTFYPGRDDLLVLQSPGQDEVEYVPLRRLHIVSMCDPHAGGSNRFQTTRAAVHTTGVDIRKGRVFILDSWIKRAPTNEVVDQIIYQNNKWMPSVFSVESNGFQKMLKFWLEERVARDGHPDVPIDEYNPRGTKDDIRRIKGLQPLFRAGNIWMLSSFVELKEEYLAWPRGKQDGLDCLAQGPAHWNIGYDAVKQEVHDEYERAVSEMRNVVTGY